jgi:hypothetical protein
MSAAIVPPPSGEQDLSAQVGEVAALVVLQKPCDADEKVRGRQRRVWVHPREKALDRGTEYGTPRLQFAERPDSESVARPDNQKRCARSRNERDRHAPNLPSELGVM